MTTTPHTYTNKKYPLPDNVIERDGIKFIEVPLSVAMMFRGMARKRLRDIENSSEKLTEKFGEESTRAARHLNKTRQRELELFISSIPKYLPNGHVFGCDHFLLDPKLKEKLDAASNRNATGGDA